MGMMGKKIFWQNPFAIASQSRLGAQLNQSSSTMEEHIWACNELSQPITVQHMGVNQGTMSCIGQPKKISKLNLYNSFLL